MAAPGNSGIRTAQSEQEIQNQGYDPTYGIPVVGLLGYNGSSVKRVQANSDGTLSLGGFSLPLFDYVSADYPNATTEAYTYKTGGSSGTTVATITVVYTNSAKEFISSVTKT